MDYYHCITLNLLDLWHVFCYNGWNVFCSNKLILKIVVEHHYSKITSNIAVPPASTLECRKCITLKKIRGVCPGPPQDLKKVHIKKTSKQIQAVSGINLLKPPPPPSPWSLSPYVTAPSPPPPPGMEVWLRCSCPLWPHMTTSAHGQRSNKCPPSDQQTRDDRHCWVSASCRLGTSPSWTCNQGALVQWLKPPAWKIGDRVSILTLAFKFQRNKMFLLRSIVMIQYCGEPPWPRNRKLGLRPP